MSSNKIRIAAAQQRNFSWIVALLLPAMAADPVLASPSIRPRPLRALSADQSKPAVLASVSPEEVCATVSALVDDLKVYDDRLAEQVAKLDKLEKTLAANRPPILCPQDHTCFELKVEIQTLRDRYSNKLRSGAAAMPKLAWEAAILLGAGGQPNSPCNTKTAYFQASTCYQNLVKVKVCAAETRDTVQAAIDLAQTNASKRVEGGVTQSVGMVAGGAGLSWQTTLVTGLADFLTDRAKQETVLWLLSTFKDKLCATGKPWFPATCQVLNSDGNQGGVPGSILGAAVRKDMERFPVRAILSADIPDQLAAQAFASYTSEIVKTLLDADATANLATLPITSLAKAFGTIADVAASCPRDRQTTPYCVLTATSKLLSTLPQGALLACDATGKTPNQNLQDAQRALQGLFAPTELSDWWQTFFTCGPKGQPARDQLKVVITDVAHLAENVVAIQARWKNVGRTERQKKLPEDLKELLTSLGKFLDSTADLVASVGGKDSEQARNITQAAIKGLRIAALTLQGLEALSDVIAGIRDGKPALEMLAGLESLAEDGLAGAVCKAGDLADETLCTVATVGVIAVRMGDAVTRLKDGDEGEMCKSILALAKNSQLLLAQLGVKEGGLVLLADKLSCTNAGLNESASGQVADAYREARTLYRVGVELVVSVQRWRDVGGGGNTTEHAASLLQWTGDIVGAVARITGKQDLPAIKLALASVTAGSAMLRGQYSNGVREVLVAIKSKVSAFPEPVRKYISLLGDLAEAQTPSQVQAALESASAPVGSWRLKRQNFVASVSGLVGVHTSVELGTPIDHGGVGYGLGAAAMLGLDLAWPIDSHVSSAGLYLSVLDVGQLAYARLASSQNTETASDVSILNVLSPGLYARFGLRRTPFTFALGCAFSPQLRNILVGTYKPDGDQVKEPFAAVRCGGMLGVDVTILPF